MNAAVGDTIVEINGLRKVYGGKHPVTAVDGIDLRVAAGELYGLLGPNGAGKTTTISIATTRAVPSAGSVRIAGVDVVASLPRRVALSGWCPVQHAGPSLYGCREHSIPLCVFRNEPG